MAKFYTRKGDLGETSLYSGERVPKDCLRIETYGTVDELQSVLGIARAATECAEIADILLEIETKLIQVMAQLATIGGNEERITSSDVERIESQIDHYSEQLPSGFRWSVPGESLASAYLHNARTVSRRAERLAISLNREESVAQPLLTYLNRISDLCYALARYEDEACA